MKSTNAYKLNHIITLIIVLGYVVVNVTMQINFFKGINIFDKYQIAISPQDALDIAQKAYYAKTGFLLLLLILQIIENNFYRSFTWSMTIYGMMMIYFFGIKTPTILYISGGLLAFGSYYYGSYLNKKNHE